MTLSNLNPHPSSPAPFAVGIDAGGTSLRVTVAARATGVVLAQRKAAPAPDGGPESVGLLLADALRAAGGQASNVGAVCAGITKWTRGNVRERWEAELLRLFPQTMGRISVVPDYVIGFHGAIASERGIAVLAGTGSVVYGENEPHPSVRVGGRGWEWGDEGSGTWITSEAIRRTLRALDGMEEITPLNQAVCERLQTSQPDLIGDAAREACLQAGRGFMVPILLSLAREHYDKEATDLFVGASGWLAAQVKVAHRRLAFEGSETVSVALVGGLWEVGDLLQEPFAKIMARLVPNAHIILPQAAPVTGAVHIARSLF